MINRQDQDVVLHGLGVPAERLVRMAEACGLAGWRVMTPAAAGYSGGPPPEGAAPGSAQREGAEHSPEGPDLAGPESAGPESGQSGADGRRACRVGRSVGLFCDAEAFLNGAIWRRPLAAWIEVGGLGDDTLGTLIRSAVDSHLFVSLTTVTASRILLAHQLVGAFGDWWPLSVETSQDIELALHEAVSNALLHGNLQINGMKTMTVGALDQFARDVAGRLADPSLAARRVEVVCRREEGTLIIDVSDQGSGYVPIGGGKRGASGRGLELIAAIAQSFDILDHGRRIHMRFAL